MKHAQVLALCLVATSLTACGAGDRLRNIGKQPALSAIENPTAQKGYRPVQMPMPTSTEPASYSPNSLWQTGSRAFFKDQRANRVGDILTVEVEITDSAKLDNTSKRSRSGSDNVGLAGSIGTRIASVIPNELIGTGDASSLAEASSASSSEGSGEIDRSESITTTIAAVVLQVLPNGNLVIEGRQEIRVNFEVRELLVAGIVRPEDISSDNTIESAKIAEARIAYGGRGQITDVQQPRYGQQVMDIILPF
ncbi:flagellar basal body L-ring protein FlgH [Cohaesibacter celericrescens]|uniref:Flagellar L-ring protein n=1 Tax=Cohaesibacter celericrescens TaxID=2067669 RepID=A0A2N5XWP6_9HYPH|nr:flagellar basal body L-ring protein FlgH [Cohaesibacter celericrescens]PLW78845.1 flagellar basal body L-ring protein [Cohaesibacter celericrescens]